MSWEFSNETVKISALICWLYGWDYINIFILSFGNSGITEDIQLKSQYWPEICISMLMVPVCGTLQGHISSRLPQNTADVKMQCSAVLSLVPTCAEISDVGTVMPFLAGSTFSQVGSFQCRVCYVLVSQSILLPCNLSINWSCTYCQLLLLFYFSLRKSSLWRSWTVGYFYLSSSRTLFSLHPFSVQKYFKCPLQVGDWRKFCISVFHLSFELSWCWSWRGIEKITDLHPLTTHAKRRKEVQTFWEIYLGILMLQ